MSTHFTVKMEKDEGDFHVEEKQIFTLPKIPITILLTRRNRRNGLDRESWEDHCIRRNRD